MYEMLSDGEKHTATELHTCCGPSSVRVVKVHICRLRKLINPKAQDILSSWGGSETVYRLVRLVGDTE